jgi:NAD(P)-dependent dehydrogenase (short-subunit alcohol dehydrogenase family)
MHEVLSKEVAEFGIKVTLIEPGAYATDFGSQCSFKMANGIDAYADIRDQIFASGANVDFGDPYATLQAILKLVDTEQPPLRVFFGTEGLPMARTAYAERLTLWESWQETSNAAQVRSHKIALDPMLG